jgi:hypothetical protein
MVSALCPAAHVAEKVSEYQTAVKGIILKKYASILRAQMMRANHCHEQPAATHNILCTGLKRQNTLTAKFRLLF